MCYSESQAREKQFSREIYDRKPEQLRLLKSMKTECATSTCHNPENTFSLLWSIFEVSLFQSFSWIWHVT